MRHRKIRAQMKNVLFYRYFGMVLLKKYIWIVWSNFVDRYLVVFPQRFLVFTNHFCWFLVARQVILITPINQSHAQFLLGVFNFHVNWLSDYFQFLGFWPKIFQTACKNAFIIVHFIKLIQKHFMKLKQKGEKHLLLWIPIWMIHNL